MAMDAADMAADGVDGSALSAALGAASAAEGAAGGAGGVQSVTQLASGFGLETEGWVPSGSYVTIHVAAEPGDDDAAVAFSGAVSAAVGITRASVSANGRNGFRRIVTQHDSDVCHAILLYACCLTDVFFTESSGIAGAVRGAVDVRPSIAESLPTAKVVDGPVSVWEPETRNVQVGTWLATGRRPARSCP